MWRLSGRCARTETGWPQSPPPRGLTRRSGRWTQRLVRGRGSLRRYARPASTTPLSSSWPPSIALRRPPPPPPPRARRAAMRGRPGSRRRSRSRRGYSCWAAGWPARSGCWSCTCATGCGARRSQFARRRMAEPSRRKARTVRVLCRRTSPVSSWRLGLEFLHRPSSGEATAIDGLRDARRPTSVLYHHAPWAPTPIDPSLTTPGRATRHPHTTLECHHSPQTTVGSRPRPVGCRSTRLSRAELKLKLKEKA
mmetsp:Transcript_10261/g.33911  ORF Transcript_10261/g.33911 Transcript_10261/m.33911 type:complete len:252 (-) Transcript_10261:36-791(-)